ncbi:hypothetical protein K438DRAFT_1630174 [Mycena galopus ATCC 62051]|nr:hypothetical protein K438DRAFT_1630174 [Mycena galopus ATCC 62051]
MTALAGVNAVLAGATPETTALSLFSLAGRVALVTGGHRAIGLEMELTLAEAGAVVYCLDLPTKPDSEWLKIQSYVNDLPNAKHGDSKGRLEYICGDVTNQEAMWSAAESIVSIEGRIDIDIANAGVLEEAKGLEYPAENFQEGSSSASYLMDVNVCGALFTVQAMGRQMERLGISGSTVLTASMVSVVHSSAKTPAIKSAVLQMTRSSACELAPKEICVNRISPGYIPTELTSGREAELSSQNPMGRFGKPDELRGATLWLASDAPRSAQVASESI